MAGIEEKRVDMLEDFMELFKTELVATVNGLFNIEPEVEVKDKFKLTHDSSISEKACVVSVSIDNEDAELKFIIPPRSVFYLAETMVRLGSIENENEIEEYDKIIEDIELNEKTLDAYKEIVSNIFGSITNVLTSQNSFPKFVFRITDIKVVENINLKGFEGCYMFNFDLNDIEYYMRDDFGLFFNSDFHELLYVEEDNDIIDSNKDYENNPFFEEETDNNFDLIKDIRIPVKVRVGQKKMLLRDVIGMDIGSIVELDQLANEPLDLLVNEKKIGEGEVVIVDGNFGIQITSLGDRKDRLNQLRG
jgi:flagellar motor switch protein FliN/FliY